VRKADNLPPSRALVTKSGSLNFLEPSGPIQACNGTALPFGGESSGQRDDEAFVTYLILLYSVTLIKPAV